ncbi:MAG TPA: GDP-mannose 4,6-dehydratase [Myxococcota bacterium]
MRAGHEVHGVARAAAGHAHLAGVAALVSMHAIDIADTRALVELVRTVAPDRCFHLAADSFIGDDGGDAAAGMNVSSTIAILETLARHAPHARFLLAGSAQQLAGAASSPQSERTAPRPVTTYGLAKQLAAEAVAFFRARGLFASAAILYNHESPRRQARFISKKLAVAAAEIARARKKTVSVGSLDAVRDWGFAPEYVDGMVRALDHTEPLDYVFATGIAHTVREMAEAAFASAGLRASDHLVVDDALRRPAEAVALIGDATRARDVLGFAPRTSLSQLMDIMVAHELAVLDREART